MLPIIGGPPSCLHDVNLKWESYQKDHLGDNMLNAFYVCQWGKGIVNFLKIRGVDYNYVEMSICYISIYAPSVVYVRNVVMLSN